MREKMRETPALFAPICQESQNSGVKQNVLPDIQAAKPEHFLPINEVGVSGLVCPLLLRARPSGSREVMATAALSVNLPASARGAHMSRLVEALESWKVELDCLGARELLSKLADRQNAEKARARFDFDYALSRQAPVSGARGLQAYPCSVTASLAHGKLSFEIGVTAPVMTVCPCSLAISATGAHCQRAYVHIRASIERFIWLEDFIDLAENSGSSPVCPALKRVDEKFVTERAFANPAFVEDVARRVAAGLTATPHVASWSVRVESMESIHNHQAFATLESGK